MKRLHVHVSVHNLDNSIKFYSNLFGSDPTVLKSDYAKWLLEDPKVNFAISMRGNKPGLDHLGIQVESDAELAEVTARLKDADAGLKEQVATTCCYAKSSKTWAADPQGVSWETFHTFGTSTVYGETAPSDQSACCVRR